MVSLHCTNSCAFLKIGFNKTDIAVTIYDAYLAPYAIKNIRLISWFMLPMSAGPCLIALRASHVINAMVAQLEGALFARAVCVRAHSKVRITAETTR